MRRDKKLTTTTDNQNTPTTSREERREQPKAWEYEGSELAATEEKKADPRHD